MSERARTPRLRSVSLSIILIFRKFRIDQKLTANCTISIKYDFDIFHEVYKWRTISLNRLWKLAVKRRS